MNIKTIHNYINETVNADDLVKNKIYKTDSNMGGTFNVKYKGFKNNKYIFKNVSNEWEGPLYSFTKDEVKNKIIKKK